MSKRESIARYSLIIKKLRRNPATFEEISNTLALESEIQDYDFNISKRTFQRDKNDILSLFHIDIRYDFSKKVYYIDDDGQPEAKERILEAFDIINSLNLSDRMSEYIHFEKRQPHGTENLYAILHAIKNKVLLQFVYENYWKDKRTQRQVEPYALKEFRGRWYVISKDLADKKLKSFALDRIDDVEILKTKFQYPTDFDVNEHFKYCFGISGPNADNPEEVILSFTAIQGRYIKSFPLHETQQILIDNEEKLRIQLKLFLTYEFIMELLSFGDTLKIIQPKNLIERVKSIIGNTQEFYK